MKRKRSQEKPVPSPQKRIVNDAAADGAIRPCGLLQILSQYGLLSVITSNLSPKDLYSLAATSKATHKAIFSCEESRSNLLKKMPCDGVGVQLRNSVHRKSKYFYQNPCSEYAKCGADEIFRKVESQPCISCGHTTCDECRIHCVYQSIYQASAEPDELPNFSGFALLSPHEMGILSPAHLGYTDTVYWADPSSVQLGPRHDRGFLDVPLESDIYAPPESIPEILHYDLGKGPLQLSHSSTSPHPSPVIQAFWDVTEQRKRVFCDKCFIAESYLQGAVSPRKCCCTLKARFLDRWLCLSCYRREIEVTEKFPRGAKLPTGECSCGQSFKYAQQRSLCLWCWGEVCTRTLAL